MNQATRHARAAGESAEKLHQEIYGTTVEDADPPPAEEGGEEVEGQEGDPPAGPPSDEGGNEGEGAPTSAAPTQGQDPAKYWEHKYKTLQGMYNKEIPQLQGDLRRLREEKAGLENIIATMTPSDPAAPAVTSQPLVTDEEIADWGPEMTDYMKRVIRQEYDPVINQLKADNEILRNQNLQLQQSVGTFSADSSATGRTRHLEALAVQVPDWQEVNYDQDFLDWLESPDAFSGRKRLDLLHEAHENNDTPRVVAFFKAFKRDKAVVTEDVPPPAAPAEPTVRLDTLVAPGKAPSTTAQPSTANDQNTKIWSQAEIQQFYRDVQRGKYRGRDAEKARTEAAIVKAGREGRVK